jgi:hypothetical protein
VDEEFTADVSGRFAARVLERVGEGDADRWPEETGLAGMEERPERPESDISVTQGRTPSKSGRGSWCVDSSRNPDYERPPQLTVPHDSGRRHNTGAQSISQHRPNRKSTNFSSPL